MKVIAVTSQKLPKISLRGFKLHNYLWQEFGKRDLNLRDYDGVILDLSEVDKDASGIDWKSFKKSFNFSVTKDILVSSSNFVVIVGNPFVSADHEDIAELAGISLKLVEGKGDSIKRTARVENSKYKRYLESIRRYDYSFDNPLPIRTILDIANNNDYESGVDEYSFLITRAGKMVAAELRPVLFQTSHHGMRYSEVEVYSGELVFLPCSTLSTTETIRTILEANQDKEGDDPAPEWVNKIKVSGQEKIEAEINSKQDIINDTLAEIGTLNLELNELRKPLEILFKSDKALEESIKNTLKDIGLTIVEPESTDRVEFYVHYRQVKIVVEIKSTLNENIDQKGLRQVLDWQNDAFDLTGEDYKPLIIASVQYSKPLEERNGEILPDNLKDYALRKGIAVITVHDLYKITQDIARGMITTQEFIDRLKSLSGLYAYDLADDKPASSE